ncbi:MAG: NAD-dependent epimerase/dehydratase family protein [Cyanobacteria bacterium P01_H01_bin.121]
MSVLITGATGLTGELLLQQLAAAQPGAKFGCLIRPSSRTNALEHLNLKLSYYIGDTAEVNTWQHYFAQQQPSTIVHIASIRHVPAILQALEPLAYRPRLIVVGTTGVYSQYNQYSATYKTIEAQLTAYAGPNCLLRPTMIYGSHRDRNLHKLLCFCNRYHCFPVFGSGQCLLQPIHAADLAQAICSILNMPDIQGNYDLSGGSVVTFVELLNLVACLLKRSVYQIALPLPLGLLAASLAEAVLPRSPVRREQILRLQEDKAYSHTAATQAFGFMPRSLAIGLSQEVQLLQARGLI